MLELVSNILFLYEVVQKKTGNGEILSSHKPSGDFLNPLANIMPHIQAQATGEAGERGNKAFPASVMVHGSCPQGRREMGEWLLVRTQENLTHSLIDVVLAYQLSRKIL